MFFFMYKIVQKHLYETLSICNTNYDLSPITYLPYLTPYTNQLIIFQVSFQSKRIILIVFS